MTANISIAELPEERISKLLSLIGQPARIQILWVISQQPACVCHLEAVMRMRQAAISQHLMILRKAGLVTTQRDRRNIFYLLANPAVLQVLEQAANCCGFDPESLQRLAERPIPNCPCPQCNPDKDPDYTCQSVRIRSTPKIDRPETE